MWNVCKCSNHVCNPVKYLYGRRVAPLMLTPQRTRKVRLFAGESEKTGVQVPPIFSGMVGVVILRFAFQVFGQAVAEKAGGDLAQNVLGDTNILGGGVNERPVVVPQDGVNRHEIPQSQSRNNKEVGCILQVRVTCEFVY